MVEAGATVDEETMLEALQIAHEEIRRLCEAQVELAKAAGKPKLEVPETPADEKLLAKIEKAAARTWPRRRDEQAGPARQGRRRPCRRRRAWATSRPGGGAAFAAFEALQKRLIRQRIAVDKARPDGRSPTRSAPSAARCACCRACTARGCSPVARPRC